MKLFIFIISSFSISLVGYAQSSNQIQENKEVLSDRIVNFEGPDPVFISLDNKRLSERVKFDVIEPTFIQGKMNASLLTERPIFKGPEAVIIRSDNNDNSK